MVGCTHHRADACELSVADEIAKPFFSVCAHRSHPCGLRTPPIRGLVFQWVGGRTARGLSKLQLPRRVAPHMQPGVTDLGRPVGEFVFNLSGGNWLGAHATDQSVSVTCE